MIDANRRLRTVATVGLLAATVLVVSSDAMTDQEHWEVQGESLGLFLHEAFGDKQPLLSSDAAGVVPFFAHMPVLDPLGLNDYHIAHEATHARGYGWVGHELGDGKYILDQKPDLLLFSSFDGSNSLFPADQQIVDDPRFKQYYQPVNFDSSQPNSIRAFLYVRRVDGKLGIRSTSNSVTIPAYLAKIDAANSVHLKNGNAVLTIAAKHDAAFEHVALSDGTWEIRVDGDQPGALRLTDLKGAGHVTDCALCLQIDGTPDISMALTNQSGGPVDLKSVTLVRR